MAQLRWRHSAILLVLVTSGCGSGPTSEPPSQRAVRELACREMGELPSGEDHPGQFTRDLMKAADADSRYGGHVFCLIGTVVRNNPGASQDAFFMFAPGGGECIRAVLESGGDVPYEWGNRSAKIHALWVEYEGTSGCAELRVRGTPEFLD